MTADGGYVYGYRIWYGASQLRFADAQSGRLSALLDQPERRHPAQPRVGSADDELARLTGQTGRTVRSLTVASVGRSSTCRIASATVSGRIHWPASYARPSCSCTFCCIGVAVRPG